MRTAMRTAVLAAAVVATCCLSCGQFGNLEIQVLFPGDPQLRRSAVVESRPCVASRASLVEPPFGFSNRRLDAVKKNPSTANAVPAIVAPPPSRSLIEYEATVA